MVLAAAWTLVRSLLYVYHFPYHYPAGVHGGLYGLFFTTKRKSPLYGGPWCPTEVNGSWVGLATNQKVAGSSPAERAPEISVATPAVNGSDRSVAQAPLQSSTSRSGTRRNSRVLLVTSVTPMLTAWAAIRVSSGPIGVPAFSKAALTRP
jgi:hypothetical protein